MDVFAYDDSILVIVVFETTNMIITVTHSDAMYMIITVTHSDAMYIQTKVIFLLNMVCTFILSKSLPIREKYILLAEKFNYLCLFGSVLMAELSKVLPLTTSCLTPRPRFTTRRCEKVASDLELGGGFCRILWFRRPLTIGQS